MSTPESPAGSEAPAGVADAGGDRRRGGRDPRRAGRRRADDAGRGGAARRRRDVAVPAREWARGAAGPGGRAPHLGLPDRPSTGDWRADLAVLARDMRAALLRRPNLTVLMTSRAGAAGGGLPTLDRALGILRAAGLPPADAAYANHALGNYVAGAALWEAVGLGGATGEARAQRARAAADAVGTGPGRRLPGRRLGRRVPVRRDGRRPVRVRAGGAAGRDRPPRRSGLSASAVPHPGGDPGVDRDRERHVQRRVLVERHVRPDRARMDGERPGHRPGDVEPQVAPAHPVERGRDRRPGRARSRRPGSAPGRRGRTAPRAAGGGHAPRPGRCGPTAIRRPAGPG